MSGRAARHVAARAGLVGAVVLALLGGCGLLPVYLTTDTSDGDGDGEEGDGSSTGEASSVSGASSEDDPSDGQTGGPATSDPPGETSDPGQGCEDWETLCGGECVDTSDDVDHCGECWHYCPPSWDDNAEVGEADGACVDGECKWACWDDVEKCLLDRETCDGQWCQCRAGLRSCHGECYDLSSDPHHCRACDQYSPTGRCEDGEPVEACAPWHADCDGGCVDLDSHPLNCGGCGRSCYYGYYPQVCVFGGCTDVVPIEEPSCTPDSCLPFEDFLFDPICCPASRWLDGPSCVAGGVCPSQ